MDGVPEYRNRIASELLGTTKRGFEQYFKYYDQLVVSDTGAHIVQVDQPRSGDLTPITHADVLEAVKAIRGNATRTLDEISGELYKTLKTKHSRVRVTSVVLLAARVMFMFDPAMTERHGSGYTIGKYKPVSWQPTQCLHAYVLECFPRASQSSDRVKNALANARSIKAWKMKARSEFQFYHGRRPITIPSKVSRVGPRTGDMMLIRSFKGLSPTASACRDTSLPAVNPFPMERSSIDQNLEAVDPNQGVRRRLHMG
ncbi:hypothetical protein AUP68_06247 [Ilyonectria robusta]